MKKYSNLFSVIMAGGSGTRFWPLSRHLYPKQLLRILGEDTLIQQTMKRVVSCMPADHVLISTNPGQADSIKVQLQQWKDALQNNFILEPESRNTAPAIGLVAMELVCRDPEAIMLVLPADHVISKEKQFRAAVQLGAEMASQGHLVTFGIQPIRPETGYGYIQPRKSSKIAQEGRLTGYSVARFVEKPDSTTAKKYVKSKNYFWNSGIFIWKASVVLEELSQYQPALGRGLHKIRNLSKPQRAGLDFEKTYCRLPSVSIDHGVMEKSSRAAVIPVDFSWSDVGSWSSLEEVAPVDRDGMVKTGRVVDVDSRDSIVYADTRLVATIGLSNMVVVDTPDATLVCPKDRSQDVKKVVEILKKQGAPEHLEHRTVFRPWGSYTVLEEGPGYKVKRVTVNPGGRLSLQYHHKRSEHWVVIQGVARVTCGENISDLQVGQSTAIPVETPHRLENPGKEVLHIIEVQNGAYLGEDDIVRIHDDYGRGK